MRFLVHHPVLNIQVDDIHEKAKAIQENGGFIVDPLAELAPGKWLCLFSEPSGVTFAMIQEKYWLHCNERDSSLRSE